jgi:8-oxo-dGTP diphosphatase
MNEMVAGFCFDDDRQSVLLILKNTPDWQKGNYNGIGGKIDLGERPLEAMIREFQEVTGLVVLGWNRFCTLEGPGWRVHFFRAFENYDYLNGPLTVKSAEGEIHLLKIQYLMKVPRIRNLDWLIPMALSMDDYWAAEFEIGEIKR